jgi:hypothetical protein
MLQDLTKQKKNVKKKNCIGRSNEILGWEGVGNRQLFWFFKV